MKITLDGTPKEIAQMLQVLQVKQPQITPGAIEAKLDSHAVTTDRIADHGTTFDRLAGRSWNHVCRLAGRRTEEEQR